MSKMQRFVPVGGSFQSYEQFKKRVRIKILPRLPRERALELMREASLLYLKQDGSRVCWNILQLGRKHMSTLQPVFQYLPKHRLATTPSLSGNMLQPDTL